METREINVDIDSFIRWNVGLPALYEQLAEEAAELAQAALKCSRNLRGENPTPVTQREAHRNLIEEFTDVCLVADILDLQMSEAQVVMKKQRWFDRVIAKEQWKSYIKSRKNQSL